MQGAMGKAGPKLGLMSIWLAYIVLLSLTFPSNGTEAVKSEHLLISFLHLFTPIFATITWLNLDRSSYRSHPRRVLSGIYVGLVLTNVLGMVGYSYAMASAGHYFPGALELVPLMWGTIIFWVYGLICIKSCARPHNP